LPGKAEGPDLAWQERRVSDRFFQGPFKGEARAEQASHHR